LTSRPQFTEHMSFAMDQGFSPPIDVPSIYHSSNTRAVPEDTIVLNSAKPSMRTVKIEEGTRSRDEVDEKGGRSFQASGLLSRSVLVQMDHLKSLITMARAQRDTDTSQRLVRIPRSYFLSLSFNFVELGKSYFTIGKYVLHFLLLLCIKINLISSQVLFVTSTLQVRRRRQARYRLSFVIILLYILWFQCSLLQCVLRCI